MSMLFCEVEQIHHSLLNLRCPWFNMKARYDDVPQVLSTLSESSIKVSEFKLFHAAYISFKSILDLEFGCLSWKSEASIDAVLIFNFLSLTGEAKRCGTDASNKETPVNEFDWSDTLRTPFVTFEHE